MLDLKYIRHTKITKNGMIQFNPRSQKRFKSSYNDLCPFPLFLEQREQVVSYITQTLGMNLY